MFLLAPVICYAFSITFKYLNLVGYNSQGCSVYTGYYIVGCFFSLHFNYYFSRMDYCNYFSAIVFPLNAIA